jgi:hypothetical protein
MKPNQRNKEIGAKAAREMGAEYQANPGSSRIEYLNDSAYYFRDGVEKLSDLTPEEREICQREFAAGIAAEKACQ